MRNLLIIGLSLGFALPALADQTLRCQKFGEDSGQGYEAQISDDSAKIYYGGQKVADLKLAADRPSPGGDQYSVRHYVQNSVNGFALDRKSGGLANLTSATIYHGGVAGYLPIAELNICSPLAN